jgi:hypothetical protein
LVNAMLRRPQQVSIQTELDSTFAETRAIFDRLLPSR